MLNKMEKNTKPKRGDEAGGKLPLPEVFDAEKDMLGQSQSVGESEVKETGLSSAEVVQGDFAAENDSEYPAADAGKCDDSIISKRGKKRKKKRLRTVLVPVLKNNQKNIKKISKKYEKNSLNNNSGDYFDGANSVTESIKNSNKSCPQIEQNSVKTSVAARTGQGQEKIKINKVYSAKNIAIVSKKENAEKISNKSEKITQKNEQKIEKNTTITTENTQFVIAKNQNKSDKADASKTEKTTQETENWANDAAEEKQRNHGFVYAEIMPKTSKKQKQQAELIDRLLEEKERETKRRQMEDSEREQKEEKMRDIMRQRRDIEYGLDSIARKSKDWRAISEEAYADAMLNRFTLLGGKKVFGMTVYDMYMGVSIAAMRYCLEYQHNLDLEREKIRQKDRQLEQLMERR